MFILWHIAACITRIIGTYIDFILLNLNNHSAIVKRKVIAYILQAIEYHIKLTIESISCLSFIS
jgi:hypothetical protein